MTVKKSKGVIGDKYEKTHHIDEENVLTVVTMIVIIIATIGFLL